MRLTVTRLDGQSLTVPVIFGSLPVQSDGEWSTVAAPMLDDADADALRVFADADVAGNVQYLYVEAGMTSASCTFGDWSLV